MIKSIFLLLLEFLCFCLFTVQLHSTDALHSGRRYFCSSVTIHSTLLRRDIMRLVTIDVYVRVFGSARSSVNLVCVHIKKKTESHFRIAYHLAFRNVHALAKSHCAWTEPTYINTRRQELNLCKPFYIQNKNRRHVFAISRISPIQSNELKGHCTRNSQIGAVLLLHFKFLQYCDYK